MNRFISVAIVMMLIVSVIACTKSPEEKFLESSKWADIEEIRASLEAGINPNSHDSAGRTALMHAASRGRADVAKLLLSKGADVNVSDKNGKTALMYAAELGQTDIAQLLIGKGADVNAKSSKGETALALALNGGHRDMVQLLKMAGAK